MEIVAESPLLLEDNDYSDSLHVESIKVAVFLLSGFLLDMLLCMPPFHHRIVWCIVELTCVVIAV